MTAGTAALDAALRRCIDTGRPQRVTVVGPAGVGTSRLVRDFTDAVSGSVGVVSGRCLSYGRGITWWPIREIVAQAASITEDDGDDGVREAVGRLLGTENDGAIAAERISGLLLGTGDSATLSEIFWSVRLMLTRVAGGRPLVMVVDDLHWAEETLLELLDDLAAAAAPALLLIGIGRPELLHRHAALGQAPSSVVHRSPLDESAGHALVAELLGAQVAPEVSRRLVDAAHGTPLCIEQLLRVLIDDGLLERHDGVWTIDHADRLPLPQGIAAVFAARLDQLESRERHVLERAAVIGEVFYPPAVAALTPRLDGDQLEEALGLLVDDGLIEREADMLAGAPAYRFRHGLLREAAYTEMLPEVRADLHERFAAWLEGTASHRAPDEIVGHHLEVAHQHRRSVRGTDPGSADVARRAVGHLHRAGRRALQTEDWSAAQTLLGRALTLARSEALAVPALAVDVADAAVGLGDLERLEALRRDGAGASGSHGGGVAEHAYLAQLLHRLDGGAAVGERQYQEVVAVVDAWERAGDSRGRARAWHCLAVAEIARGRAGAAATAAETAIGHALDAGIGLDAVQSACLVADGLRLGPEPAVDAIRRIGELRDAFPTSRIVAYVTAGNLAILHAMCGEIDRARTLAGLALRIVDELGRRRGMAVACGHYAAPVELLAGDTVAATALLQRTLSLSDAVSGGVLAPPVLLLVDTLLAGGEIAAARDYLELIRPHALVGDPVLGALWRAGQARVLAAGDDHEAAVATATDAVALAESTDFLAARGSVLLAQAAVAEAAGDGPTARVATLRAAELLEAKGDSVSATAARLAVPASGVVPPTMA